MTPHIRAPEFFEVVVELGGRSFADDNRWRIAAGIALLLAAAFCTANDPDHAGPGRYALRHQLWVKQ